MVRRFANVNGETLFLLLSQQKKIRLKRSQRTWNIKIHSTGSHSKRRDFRCKNISNCCRNALTLFHCLFFFSLLLMYTICQGHESSSTNRQSRWNFLYNLSSFFLWCNNENEARADISQSDAVSNRSSGGKVTFCARAKKKKKQLWAGTVRNVKSSQEVDFIFNWSTNFKPSVCCASCRNPHIFSLQVVNTSARLETISTTNWPVMPLRFIYFFRSTSEKFRPFSDRCKLETVTWKLIVRKC